MTALTIGAGAFANRNTAREQEAQRILQDAKRLVIAHLANSAGETNAPPTGTWNWFPDLPSASQPGYDGRAEAGCATRTWTPGQALQSANTSGSDARCFGRLPWRQFNLVLEDPAGTDTAGLMPWVVFASNLATNQPCVMSSCPNPRWLRVVDERGNLLSDRVAFVLILPGPPLPGQTRSANAGPAAYLDTVTVQPGCPVPCQPGTYNNAQYNQPNNQPRTLIRAPLSGTPLANSNTYAQPYAFNDQLIYVTVDELRAAIQQRVQ